MRDLSRLRERSRSQARERVLGAVARRRQQLKDVMATIEHGVTQDEVGKEKPIGSRLQNFCPLPRLRPRPLPEGEVTCPR
jgi:hypothetical protein